MFLYIQYVQFNINDDQYQYYEQNDRRIREK